MPFNLEARLNSLANYFEAEYVRLRNTLPREDLSDKARFAIQRQMAEIDGLFTSLDEVRDFLGDLAYQNQRLKGQLRKVRFELRYGTQSQAPPDIRRFILGLMERNNYQTDFFRGAQEALRQAHYQKVRELWPEVMPDRSQHTQSPY